MIPGVINPSSRVVDMGEGFGKLAVFDGGGSAPRTGDYVEVMESVWFPTPEEIARLVAGAPVLLTVAGKEHPPVTVQVGAVPT